MGKRLRELRGFETTQDEFGRRIGVSQSYISSAEHGENEIGAEVLLRLSLECGRSIEWILTGKDSIRRRQRRVEHVRKTN